jgi:hypothetical protein
MDFSVRICGTNRARCFKDFSKKKIFMPYHKFNVRKIGHEIINRPETPGDII